jgi:uncharacterized protein (TIGR03435 family)
MLFNPRRGGRFTATNCSLGLLIQYAYDVMQFQISGAPDWVQSDRYDIAAKAEGDPPVNEIRAMLQGLLEDRFQLKHHWETKEAPVYHLVVSKTGKLRESEPGDCPPPLSPTGLATGRASHRRAVWAAAEFSRQHQRLQADGRWPGGLAIGSSWAGRCWITLP